jgi:hypothetical protein
MPAVNQDAQADPPRASKIEETVHGGADRTPGVKNVVDDDQVAIVHGKIDLGTLERGLRTDCGKIVAVERDVQNTHRNIRLRKAPNRFHQAVRQSNSAAPDPDESEVLCAATLFDDLVGEPLKRSADLFRGK